MSIDAPLKLYKQFVRHLPRCCVDVVVKHDNQFILLKRKNNPAKNQWWFPGGGVLFNNSLEITAEKKLKEELGITKIKSLKFLGVGETKFKKGYFNFPSHTINNVFLAEIDDFQAEHIKLDLINHWGYKWLDKIPSTFHPYLKKFLKLAGFKQT